MHLLNLHQRSNQIRIKHVISYKATSFYLPRSNTVVLGNFCSPRADNFKIGSILNTHKMTLGLTYMNYIFIIFLYYYNNIRL